MFRVPRNLSPSSQLRTLPSQKQQRSVAMAKRTYIDLKTASKLFADKGLDGQTVSILRTAIANGRLRALKDGRSWKTTIGHLEAYEETLLWRGEHRGSSYSGRTRSTGHGRKRASKTTAGTSSTKGRKLPPAIAWLRGERQSLP